MAKGGKTTSQDAHHRSKWRLNSRVDAIRKKAEALSSLLEVTTVSSLIGSIVPRVADGGLLQSTMVFEVAIAIRQPSARKASGDYRPLCSIVGGVSSPARGE